MINTTTDKEDIMCMASDIFLFKEGYMDIRLKRLLGALRLKEIIMNKPIGKVKSIFRDGNELKGEIEIFDESLFYLMTHPDCCKDEYDEIEELEDEIERLKLENKILKDIIKGD